MLPGLSSANEIKARMLFFLSAAIDRLAIITFLVLLFPLFLGDPANFNLWGERERCTGIEPASSAWEADALPMC